jgi:sugar lactone lactonase YvrE
MPFSHSIPKSAGFVSRLYLTESSVFPGALTGRLRAVALVLVCLLASLAPCQLQAQTITQVPYITTVAGTGTPGYSGDGKAATSAALNQPFDVIVDRAGNLYIADTFNHVIRKVDTSGTITTVAGNGTLGYSGDGYAATSAQLHQPSGLAIDSAGNLYIADAGNNATRKVATTGIITTIAGNGTACGASTGLCGDGGSAAIAYLSYPTRVAVDKAGNLYIGDVDNNRIRVVNTQTTPITVAGVNILPGYIATVAGNGFQGFSGGTGPATSAELQLPWGVAVDSAGNLYIADYVNQLIRKVDTGGNLSTVAGVYQCCDTSGDVPLPIGGYSGDGGPATSAQLDDPVGVAVDSAGNLYIADSRNERIRKVDTNGKITTVAGDGTVCSTTPCGDGGPATSAQLSGPSGVALDSAGNLYIADTNNSVIRKVVNGPVPFFNVSVGSSNSQLVRLSINSSSFSTPQLSLSDYSAVQNGSCIPWIGVSFMCAWNVTFAPTKPGPRWSSFTVIDGNSLIKYSFGLEGTGVAPAVAFTPGIISTVAGAEMAVQPAARDSTIPLVSQSTAQAICTSQRTVGSPTTASARWTAPLASSTRWPEVARTDIPETAFQPLVPNCIIPVAWRWTAPATSTSLTPTTCASARWTPTALLAPSRVEALVARKDSTLWGTAAQPRVSLSMVLPA